VQRALAATARPSHCCEDPAVIGHERLIMLPALNQDCLDTGRSRHHVPELTTRQRQLLDLLADGHTNAQIARRLGIAEGTVRKHLENIYRRLGVSSRTAAVTRALLSDRPSRPWPVMPASDRPYRAPSPFGVTPR
jgi:DNA-binding NarL/FixJ family response regulator